MSTPIDLSDALKTPPPSLSSPPTGRKDAGRGRGSGTRLDDYARPTLWVALTVSVLLLIYLGWGLFGGAWSDPGWSSLKANPHNLHLYHLQQMGNIGMIFSLLRIAILVLLASLLICCLRDDGLGYVLLGTAAALYFGLPLLADQIYAWQGLHATSASQDVLREMQTVALLLGVPGLAWTAVEVGRRFHSAAEAAAIRRANLKYATASQARSLGVKVRSSRLTAQQRQYRNYQFMAVALLIAEPVLVLLNLDAVKAVTGRLLGAVENITNRFAFQPHPDGIAQLHDSSADIVLWTVLIALNLVLLAQALRLLEFVCFRNRA